MSGFQVICYDKSFSQLAKESSFTFNLYRGRVDWKKLEELDVDRVVRDQDVELLHLHLNSVTNCSLESEYDVKILDPNFIKLFRLAQLLIDFLLHCKKYLEHCIKVAHESLQTSNKEVEILKKQLQARKTEVKQLKKKFKEVKQQLLLSPGAAGPTFECSLCGKVFMSETFLHGHHSRRHQPLPYSLVLRPFNMAPASPHVKCTSLKMDDQLANSSPRKWKSTQCCTIVDQHSAFLNSSKIIAQENEEKANKNEEITSIKKKYQEEIEDLKKLFFAEIEKLKENDNVKKSKTDIQTQYSKDEKEEYQSESKQHQAKSTKGPLITVKEPRYTETEENIKSCKATEDQRLISQNENQILQRVDEKQSVTKADLKAGSENGTQAGEGEGEWANKFEEREAVWRARLTALDQQHKKQVQQLQDRLNTAQLQGQEIKKDLELRLEEVLAKFEQSQKILENKSQGSVQDDRKHTSKDKKEKEEKHNQIKISSGESLQKDSPKQPPPFQKRRAFVSQKTKTIQDSFEIPENEEPPENLVQVLNPDDDSDLENVSMLTQNSSREKINKIDLVEKRTSPVIKVKDKTDETFGRSKNKESIIAKLLEEERLRNIADKKKYNEDREMEEDEDSTLSGSVTETESESGGEGGDRRGERVESHSSDDQMLKEESDLAQQSLQSMEALLAANPGILQQLRADLEGLVGRRLQSLGVDPAWRGLPPATYRDKMAALAHQRNITAKSHPVYFTLRDKLRGDAESAVTLRSRDSMRTSAADSLLSRLRSKAAQVISAARFTRRLGSHTKQESLPKQNLSRLSDRKPLAASSPQLSPEAEDMFGSNQLRNTSVITKVQSAAGESFSLSSSTEEGDEEGAGRVSVALPHTQASYKRDEDIAGPVIVISPHTQASYKRDEDITGPESVVSPQTQASYKSALRHTVSTSNLAKKKVLFVDEAFTDSKRSQSENTIPARQNLSIASQVSGSESVASLVKEIQQQLSTRSGKPSFSVDLMKQPDPAVKASEIPLSEILPLTKSGRDLLDSQSMNSPKIQSVKESAATTELKSPLSQILQRVPTSKPGSSTSLGKKPDLLEWSSKSQLQPPKLSPAPSLSSIGSSLLDLSASPRTPRRPLRGSLEWDLQDLEDNLKD